jgi:two-component system cell cycle sensor histidine kinase/response regulator CckA
MHGQKHHAAASNGAAGSFGALGAFGSSEELFRALTSHTPVGVFVSDADGCVYVNDCWCELAGLGVEEALGDGWARALHPDDAERVLAEWASAASEGRDSVGEYRFRRPDGTVAWVRGFAAALRDDDGRIVGWSGTCLDLTAGHRRERQQEMVADFGLRTLSSSSLEAVLRDAVETLAQGLEVEYASFLELQDDGVAMRLGVGYGWNLVGTEAVARLDAASPAAQALRASVPVLVEHVPGSDSRGAFLTAHEVASSAAMVIRGSERPFGALTAHSRRAGAFGENDLYFLRAVTNVVAAKLDRQRTERSARHLAAIVESTVDAIWSRTPDGIVTSWNAAAERMYGYRAEEMVGSSIAVVVPADLESELEQINERLLRGETVEQLDTVRIRKDGTRIDVAITLSPIKDVSGATVAVSAISRDISERKRIEAALRKSEAGARAVLESALDAVVTINHEGTILEFNPAAEKIFGHRRVDVLGSSMSDLLVPPALREQHGHGFARYLATGEARILGKRIEIVAVRADGTEIPVELTVNAVQLDGPPVFTAFIRDISDRRQAEREQRELAAIVGASKDAIIGTTLDGIVTSWNAGAERIYGYAAHEVLGGTATFMVPPERTGESVTLVERLRRGEHIRHFETVRQRKDGTRFDVSLSVSPIADADGRITGLSVTAHDITERKRVEMQLRQSEARYRELFENASDLIATVDLESRFTDVNTAFARALGYTREELVGRPLADVVPPEALESLQEARLGKLGLEVDATLYEHELIAKDGSRIEVEVSSRLITENGEPVGIEAICRDVSERKRLEAQLRQAQKMEAIGKLAGGIAHDFNNLLTVINGNADRALGLDDVDAIKASLHAVLKAGTTAGALTRQLLAFGRLQVLRPRVLDLDDVLGNMQELLERLIGDNVALRTMIEPGLGRVLVDPNQIEQVLLNLAVNAREAMSGEGAITIAAENTEVDEAYASSGVELEPGPYVALTVTDTGVGMDDETRSRIFEPFFTTKAEGTGLGLATVYGIVKQSGGNISVYSEPGAGTTFRLLFPRVDAQAEIRDVPGPDSSDLTGTETIMVIEDNDLIRELAAEILTSLGYTVVTAGCADEALPLAAACSDRLDLVMSDVMLPGQSGPELVAEIQCLHPQTKTLYTSGYAPALAGERGGFELDQAFLAKPFTSVELASLVRRVLDA